jgi:hypothetical protein
MAAVLLMAAVALAVVTLVVAAVVMGLGQNSHRWIARFPMAFR